MVMASMLGLMKPSQMVAYLETNGTLGEELSHIIDDIDIIAMDIKMPSSTKCREFWKEHQRFLKIAQAKEVFIKTVVTSDTDQEDIHKTVDMIFAVDPHLLLILQPNTYELKNGVMSKCLDFQKFCLKHLPNTKVLPQVHKFMKLR